MIIYRIINKINEKSYIGQTASSIKTRWLHHCQPNRKRKHTGGYTFVYAIISSL